MQLPGIKLRLCRTRDADNLLWNMARISSREFAGTRSRLQRFRDAKLFNGWIESFGETSLDVTTTTSATIEIGDTFNVEVFGNGVYSTFHAEVESIRPFDMMYGGQVRSIGKDGIRFIEATQATVRLNVTSTIRFSQGTESVRIKAADHPVSLTLGEDVFQGTMIDMSPKGMGITVDEKLEPLSKVDVTVTSPFGNIVGTCEVRYCRPIKLTGQFRCGLMFSEIERLQEQRWARFLREFC